MALKIAVVGNSPMLLRMKLGREIDAHDLVIRINEYYRLIAPEITGVKQDVWSCCFNKNHVYDDGGKSKEVWVARPIYWDSQNGDKWCVPEKIKSRVTQEINSGEHSQIECELKKLPHGNNPTTGFVTIRLAMRLYPDVVPDLYGFGFYAEKRCYYDDKNTYCFERDHNPSVERQVVAQWAAEGKVNWIQEGGADAH